MVVWLAEGEQDGHPDGSAVGDSDGAQLRHYVDVDNVLSRQDGLVVKTNPPIVPAQDTTLCVADVQGRRRSQ